jgi:hypothetical protein
MIMLPTPSVDYAVHMPEGHMLNRGPCLALTLPPGAQRRAACLARRFDLQGEGRDQASGRESKIERVVT